MATDIVLKLENIHKYFGDFHAITNANMAIKENSFVTFLGPSGCGKTTLLRMIAGFYEPDEGQILLSDERIEKLPPYKRNTSMVFQEYALFPHLNVYENVSYGLKIRGDKKETIKAKVASALNTMQLTGLEERFPSEMSGGQQQRVAVARALVMSPKLLLLDEPLSNLDAKLREQVRVELREIQQKMGLTAIYVTHDQSEALSMSDIIVVLRKGVIEQIGSPYEIYFEPKNSFVADFIGTTNLIVVETKKSGELSYFDEFILKKAKAATNHRKYVISLRPECLTLSYEKSNDESVTNLKAKIIRTSFLGSKTTYFLKDQHEKEWIVDIFDPGKEHFEGEVYIQFLNEKAWLIDEKEIRI